MPTKQYRDHAEEIADAIAHRDDPPPLTIATRVWWPDDGPQGGSYSTYGELMVQDRKVVAWDLARGEYVGSYPY